MIEDTISSDEFFKLYPGRADLWELLTTKPKNTEELISKYLPSKLWRLNNLYEIIDKDGNGVPFKMRFAQFFVYSCLFKHRRLIILKSRQQGISTLWLVCFFDDAIFKSNLSCGLMAQGQSEATTLLERVKHLWDKLDPAIKSFLQRKLVKNNTSEFSFDNNSKLFIRTSFRSATLQRLHISELGKIANKSPEKAKETKTGTMQTIKSDNPLVVESTAEGDNIFKKMWDTAVQQQAIGRLAGKDFYPVFLSWLDDPDCVEHEPQIITQTAQDYFIKVEKDTGRTLTPEQKNFWIAQERELEGDIHQEYPATPEEAFAAAKDGTYWARRYLECIIRKSQNVSNLYDHNLPVYCIMDLGHSDYMVLTFVQFFGKTMRIIGEYYNCGEGLEHYADYLKTKIPKEWDVQQVALPHDAVVTDLSARGRTRQEILADEGITNTVVLRKDSLGAGIQNVRNVMDNIWIDKKCVYIEKCMLNYSKEWNPLLNVWKDAPKRNEHSHGADTVRYAVQYWQEHMTVLQSSSRGRSLASADGVSL